MGNIFYNEIQKELKKLRMDILNLKKELKSLKSYIEALKKEEKSAVIGFEIPIEKTDFSYSSNKIGEYCKKK